MQKIFLRYPAFGFQNGFQIVIIKFIQLSALLDGGFEPHLICAYMGYSRTHLTRVKKLKKEGKSLARGPVGTPGRTKSSER